MPQVETAANVVLFKRPERGSTGDAGDLRFRALLGEQAWAALPAATRARFGKRVDQGHSVLYSGDIVECRISRTGWLLGQALRIMGAPLPLSRDEDVPASVCVTEDAACGGQFWTRIYGRRRGFPPGRPAWKNMSAAGSASRFAARLRTRRSIS
jgi:hypothetical protein